MQAETKEKDDIWSQIAIVVEALKKIKDYQIKYNIDPSNLK